jgi:NAD(P)-dependent dehydrogenase (short-subunit alcohol dehydrogenase family)
MESFDGKAAVITGGASGIGLAIARALVAEGARVAIADINLEKAQAEAIAMGDAARAYRCDVTKTDDVAALADAAWAEFGRVDLLFNNAGVMPRAAPLIETAESDLRWVYEVNVFGAFWVLKTFAARMVGQVTPSHIVTTGSENSLCSLAPMMSAYNSAKHAVLGLNGILRMELPEHVGISLFCPGIVKTRLSAGVESKPEEFGGPEADLLGGMPIGMEPEEAAWRCLQGVKRGDYFIVTHYATRYLAEELCNEIMQAFDAQTEACEGWEEWDTRKMIMGMLRARRD